MDEKKLAQAQQIYSDLCAAIDKREWNYTKNEEQLMLRLAVNGEDIPMQFIMMADIERQLLRVLSPLPFKFAEDKRIDGAIAACVATYGLADGSFDYDIKTGSVFFKQTVSFRESTIGEELFQYVISCACFTVDKYNDKFLALNNGMISISDFISKF